MDYQKQIKAKNADPVRTETLTFRLNKRLRSLAEIAARSKGVKLANYVEGALEASLSGPVEFLGGASIAAKADELYDDDDATCFLKRLCYPWSMNPGQKRLFDLIRASKVLYPDFGRYDDDLISQYWGELCAIADGSDDARAVPLEIFDGVDIEFALMNEAERVAFFQRDPEECAHRTQAYMQQTKRVSGYEVTQTQ